MGDLANNSLSKLKPFVEKTISGQKVLIDTEDAWILDKYSWWYSEKSGVECREIKGGETIILHRLLLSCPDDKQVDHVNRKNWDNRRSNLRIATKSQNQHNRDKQQFYAEESCTSRFKGVQWKKSHKCWVAIISVNKTSKFLGHFDSEIEAAKAYNQAAKEYHKEFAVLNTINGEVI